MRYVFAALVLAGALLGSSYTPTPQIEPTETPIPTVPFVLTPGTPTLDDPSSTETPIPTLAPIRTPPPGTPLPDPGDPPVQPFPARPVYLPIILHP